MEVIAFSMGDSSKTETWSNVPYFFLKALEKENVKVYRCNIRIQDESKLVFWTGKVFNYIIRKMGERGYYSFERTVIYNFLVREKCCILYANFQMQILCYHLILVVP